MDLNQIYIAIQSQYPDIWGLVNKPGVLDVLSQAVQENWPSSRTQAALEQTQYFQSTPYSQRAWEVTYATDPATSQQRKAAIQKKITDTAHTLGIDVPADYVEHFTSQAAINNWDDTQIRDALLNFNSTPQATGQINGVMENLRAQAADYGVPIANDILTKWARDTIQGTLTPEGFQGYLKEQAKSMFPGLASAIDAGVTVRQYVDPYAQLAVQNLGINPVDFNLLDPKWSRAINQIDPTTGNRVAMSLDQWVSTLRGDPTYGYDKTTNGRSAAMQLSQQIQQAFGNAA